MAGGLKSIDASDQFPGMAGKVIGEIADHLVREIEATTDGQPCDNSSSDVMIRGKNRRRDTTAKSTGQLTPEPCQPFDITIACKNYLFSGSVQAVDRTL